MRMIYIDGERTIKSCDCFTHGHFSNKDDTDKIDSCITFIIHGKYDPSHGVNYYEPVDTFYLATYVRRGDRWLVKEFNKNRMIIETYSIAKDTERRFDQIDSAVIQNINTGDWDLEITTYSKMTRK